MTITEPAPAVPPGLKGVAVTDTAVGDVRGSEGFYHYRQYSATELAERRTLEDIWQLLLDGALPESQADATRFQAETARARTVPDVVWDLLPGLARTAGPQRVLQGVRSALSTYGSATGMLPVWDITPAQRRQDLIRVAAVTPVLTAALYRLAQGLEPVPADPDLSLADNYLWMLTGRRADAGSVRALEQYLMLTVDHGFNSSTFTARVIASTGADVAAAVVGAIGALSGPLHGGAPSRALDTLDAIGTPEAAEPYVRALLRRGERVMGFGHAVYRTDDPRSTMLRQVAIDLGAPLAPLAVDVEATILRLLAETRPTRPLYTNVEYYAGVVMDGCGLPREMFTPTFAVSRVIGWCANISEQADERQLIRPAARYIGPPPPVPVPLAV